MQFEATEYESLALELIRSMGVQEAKGILTRFGFRQGSKFFPSVLGLQRLQSLREVLHTFLVQEGMQQVVVEISRDQGGGPVTSVISFQVSDARTLRLLRPWYFSGWCSGYASVQLGRSFIYRLNEFTFHGGALAVLEGREEIRWEDGGHEPLVDYRLGQRSPQDTRSLAMRICVDRLKDVALGENSICLQMERGDEPINLGRFIHSHSQRSTKNFVYLEGKSYERNLFENSLLSAAGGTLFVSAIETLPLLFQRRLIEVMTRKETVLDIRLIASSEHSLAQSLRDQRLIPELARLLQVCEIFVPTLRMRMEDLIPLAKGALERFAPRAESTGLNFSAAVLNEFLHYHWPGGTQELNQVVTIMLERRREGERVLDIRHLPPNFGAKPGAEQSLSLVGLSLAEVERRLILTTLHQVRGNKREAARVLRIGYNTLWRKLQLYEKESRKRRRNSGVALRTLDST